MEGQWQGQKNNAVDGWQKSEYDGEDRSWLDEGLYCEEKQLLWWIIGLEKLF